MPADAPLLTAEGFLDCAAQLCKDMEGLPLEELHALWRRSAFPYTMRTEDPFSPAYRDEVLSLYGKLCAGSYRVENEMTSTKQSAEEFRIGYPWVSSNLRVVAEEMSKTVQAMAVMHQFAPEAQRFIEFGSGWGNLSIPLARSGKVVTAIDIDEGFLKRLGAEAAALGTSVDLRHTDFLSAAQTEGPRYDVAIFQASFHHCIEFVDLIDAIRDNILTAEGRIFFFSEPISEALSFPWGLRYDGESVWAISCNHWLELGFSTDFFVEMMLRGGFFVSRTPGIPGQVGDGWMAQRATSDMPFDQVILPPRLEGGWHAPDHGIGRFTTGEAQLPIPPSGGGNTYDLTLTNYLPCSIEVTLITDGEQNHQRTLSPAEEWHCPLDAQVPPLVIRSDAHRPIDLGTNDDSRSLGVAVTRLRLR